MTSETIRQLIKNAVEDGAELYWQDFAMYDFDDDVEMWATIELGADERAAAIHTAAQAFPDLVGGLPVPTSFVESAAHHGHFDLFGEAGGGLLYSYSWVEGNLAYGGELLEMLFSVPPGWGAKHADGRRVAGMCMPDNPGDMPAYLLLAAFELQTGPDECLWLYRGADAAWGGGIELAPMGATYHEVVAMLLTGVAAALFLPPDEATAALEHITETELARSLLAGLRQLCDACAGLELVAEGPNGDVLLSAQTAALRPRIERAAAALGGFGELPFGRNPVSMTMRPVNAKSRKERFVEASPDEAAMIEAVRRGDVEAVRRHLDAGVDANTRDSDSTPVLLDAVTAANANEIVNMLLEHGADPMLRGYFGATVLHNVAYTNEVELAKRLIALGADLDAGDDNGGPPIFNAIENHRTEILRVLLEAGADPNVQSDTGWRALRLAKSAGTPEAVDLLRKHGAIED